MKKSQVPNSNPQLPILRRLRLLSALAIGLIAIGALVNVLARTYGTEDEVWKRVQETGTLTLATDASYPPFEALDANGAFFGFDIDLADEIGRRLGVQVQFENIAYDGLLGTVITQRDDAVISALVPLPERLKEVSYTRPYFNAGPVVVARASSSFAPGPEAHKGEWARGRTIAVEYGSNSDALARGWVRVYPDISLRKLPTAGDAMQAVADGNADEAVVDAVSAFDFLKGHGDLLIAGAPLEDEFYAVAVSAKSTDLLAALNIALDEMEKDGSLAELLVKWFGEAAR